MKSQNKGTLFLIPSPLDPESGSETLSPEISRVLQSTNYYLVENERTARRYISSLDLGINIPSLHFDLLDKNTQPEALTAMMKPLNDGFDIAIISEAGCPGVADPGSLAVDFAHRKGFKVVPLVGPSSFLLALMASGLSGQSFSFHGYLPVHSEDLKKALKNLERESTRTGASHIFMETPYRNQKMIEAVLEACQPDTRLCIAAGLTGPYEMIRTMTIKAWKGQIPDIHKIPAVFIIQG